MAVESGDWIHTIYLGIPLWRYIFCVLLLGLIWITKNPLEGMITKWIEILFNNKGHHYHKSIFLALKPPISALLIIASLFLGFEALGGEGSFPPKFYNVFERACGTAVGVLLIWGIYRLIDVFAQFLHETSTREHTYLHHQFVPLIRKSLKIIIAILGVLTILASLNIDIAGLITGLGIGGLAVALAAQDTLGNFFGSMTLLADRTFQVGDKIFIGDKIEGVVESIGFRSTRLRTPDKSVLIMPNKVLANENINNWAKLPKRSIKQTIGIGYEATSEQLREVMNAIKEAIRSDPEVDDEEIVVRFTDFGESAFTVTVNYFTKHARTDNHLEVKERVNFYIREIVDKFGLTMPFPTQAVHLYNISKPTS